MQNFFEILESNQDKAQIEKFGLNCFYDLIKTYPQHYKKIIKYINQCYNYRSTYLSVEFSWTDFLNQRFKECKIPANFRKPILNLTDRVVTMAIYEFLQFQKASTFETLVAKQGLRRQMLEFIQRPAITATNLEDKEDGNQNVVSQNVVSVIELQKANELITTLDKEIGTIYEELRADQKVIGNYKGYDAVKQKAETEINIAGI